MNRCASGLAFALVSVLTVGLSAQDPQVKTETKIKADDAKVVTFTGCVQAAPEPSAFILANVVPVSKSVTSETATGTSGAAKTTTTTTTTYALVPGEATIEFKPHVGQKVEVTGLLLDAAKPGDDDAKIKMETKTKVEGKPETKETTKAEVPLGKSPQLKVLSVKPLGQPCVQ
jgi:hypothetical protein